MWPHRLIHDIHVNKPVLNLYFRFEFFIRKLDSSLCTSLIIGLKRILMIDADKNVIRYYRYTRTSLCKQICILANDADLIDRRETCLTK